jgi:hypothetical protein
MVAGTTRTIWGRPLCVELDPLARSGLDDHTREVASETRASSSATRVRQVAQAVAMVSRSVTLLARCAAGAMDRSSPNLSAGT